MPIHQPRNSIVSVSRKQRERKKSLDEANSRADVIVQICLVTQASDAARSSYHKPP